MTRVEIETSFAEIIASSLAIEPARITSEATLTELGAESLDVVEIAMEAESKFNVWLPDKSILDTAIEVAGRSAVLDESRLTEYAKDMFRSHLPAEEHGLLDGDVAVAELRRYFMRVGSWVRLIENLRRHTPKSCAQCDAEELTDRPGFILACESCGHEMKLRPGQEINREWVERFVAVHPVPDLALGSLSGQSLADEPT